MLLIVLVAAGGGTAGRPRSSSARTSCSSRPPSPPWLLDHDITISAAEQTCADIREGEGDDEVVEAARKRFIGVDAEQARKIVDEVGVRCKP